MEFWENQRTLQLKRTKSMQINQMKQFKELKEKFESEQLKHQNQINNLIQKSKQFRSAAIKYKSAYIQSQKNNKKLQNDLAEKERQFNNMNVKYNQLLRQKKRNKSKSPSIGSITTDLFNSSISTNPGKRQRPTQRSMPLALPNHPNGTNGAYHGYNRHKRPSSLNNFQRTQYHPYSQQTQQRHSSQPIPTNYQSSFTPNQINPVKFLFIFL